MFNLFSKIKKYLKIISAISGILLVIVGTTILVPAVLAEQKEELKQAADFTLSTFEGKTLRLSDFKGKIIILNFWAMFCPPCRKEIPDFVKLYDKYKDRGVVIIGINLDRANIKKLKRFSQDMGINYPLVRGDYAVTKSYGGIRYIPSTFIIDREMNIVKEFIGYTSLEAFESQINELLSK